MFNKTFFTKKLMLFPFFFVEGLNYPKLGDSVEIYYIGSFPDGTVFDFAYNRFQSVHFVLGGNMVIPGFEEVILTMSRGQKS